MFSKNIYIANTMAVAIPLPTNIPNRVPMPIPTHICLLRLEFTSLLNVVNDSFALCKAI